MGADKRKHPRVPLSMLVQIKLGTMEEFMSHAAADISIGGMFVATPQPREVGTDLFFQLLVGGKSHLEGAGRVVHVNPPNGPRPSGMGIEFTNLSEASKSFVEKLVAQRLKDSPPA